MCSILYGASENSGEFYIPLLFQTFFQCYNYFEWPHDTDTSQLFLAARFILTDSIMIYLIYWSLWAQKTSFIVMVPRAPSLNKYRNDSHYGAFAHSKGAQVIRTKRLLQINTIW